MSYVSFRIHAAKPKASLPSLTKSAAVKLSASFAANYVCFMDKHVAFADDIVVRRAGDAFVKKRTLNPIPPDLSSLGASAPNSASSLPDVYLVPVVPSSPSSFDGADNLGGILWAISLYFGIFQPLFQRNSVYFSQPSEWLLYPLAKALQQEQEDWFVNFSEGLQYQTPPLVDLGRAIFFVLLGFWTNFVIVNSLGGDMFWGWSTGACVALPATLLSFSRIKRPSREDVDQENTIKQNFETFAEKRLKRIVGRVAAESSIVLSFRRSFVEYRSRDQISDKELCKIVRAWVGYKANIEGDYLGIELINRRKEAANQIQLQKKILASQRSIEELTGKKSVSVLVDGEDEECDKDDIECLTEGKDFMR